MKKIKEYAMVYTVGALGYSIIEIFWRGFTHWTMTLTGGICFLSFHITNMRHIRESLGRKCLRGCGIITAVEFLVGCVVNRIFKMNVWDYSRMRFNILGQICPVYTVLWFFLCIPMTYLSRFIKHLSAFRLSPNQ